MKSTIPTTTAIMQKIIDKVNEGQEKDVPKYTWGTIPESLKLYWYENLK